MPRVSLPTGWQRLGRRQTWLRVFTYALFVFSTFSIAGIDAAIILLYLGILYHRMREPVAEPLPRWIVAAFLLLPAAALASALANGIEAPLQGSAGLPNPLSNLGQLRELYRLLLPLALLPVLGRVKRERLLLTLLVFSAAMALYAVVQFGWGVDWLRPAGKKLITPYYTMDGVFEGVYHGMGNFSHHLTFSEVMLMLAPLFASLAWEGAGRLRAAWSVGALLAAVGVLVSLGRSGWLGMGVGLLMLLLRFPRRIVAPVAATAVLLGLAASLLGTGWLRAHLPTSKAPAIVERLLSASIEDNKERLYLWQSGLMGIRERPWLGVGYGNVKYYAPAYRTEIAERENFAFMINLDASMHNVYLQIGFEMGLVGLAAYLLWWGAIFRWNRMWLLRAGKGYPFERALLYGTSGSFAGILTSGLFENSAFDAEVQTLILILMGLSLHAGLQIRRGGDSAVSPQ